MTDVLYYFAPKVHDGYLCIYNYKLVQICISLIVIPNIYMIIMFETRFYNNIAEILYSRLTFSIYFILPVT